jgi:hypothetical protein
MFAKIKTLIKSMDHDIKPFQGEYFIQRSLNYFSQFRDIQEFFSRPQNNYSINREDSVSLRNTVLPQKFNFQPHFANFGQIPEFSGFYCQYQSQFFPQDVYPHFGSF